MSDFERIGWGPVLNTAHDLGTDLWIDVRDERRFQLGLMVGAQVKSGPHWFGEPELDEQGQLVGWWFRDDRGHFDSWLSHAIPHLVVLHDLDARISYWAHVTNEAVQITGSQAKILVPKENTVDAAHRDQLIDAAATGQEGVPWEGSIWMAGAAIPPADHLRHALMVPRLIAPHPNAGRDQAISPEQAVAMLMQARLFDLQRMAEGFPEVPKMAEAHESAEWGWQFAGAVYARATSPDIEPLLARADDAPDPPRLAAATVAAASALIEAGRIEEAIGRLSAVIDADRCGPVDHNWLRVQRARAQAEVGAIGAAHEDAIGAQATRQLAPKDATAGAITAAATVLLFNTSSWGDRDLRDVITSADTAAGWWRSQVTSRGFEAALDRWFKAWADDRSVTLGGEDVAHNQLAAASLTASHTGDQAGWRRLSGLQAVDQLVRHSRDDDPEDVAQALTGLRQAGDEKGLTLAIHHVIADGPARAVGLAGAEIDLGHPTRTTGLADLRFLRYGGDLLGPTAATEAVDWILATLQDATNFIERTRPTYFLDVELPETLAGVIHAADVDAQRRVAAAIIELPRQDQQPQATAWARVLEAIPEQVWSVEDAPYLAAAAAEHHFPLPTHLLGTAATLGDTGARQTLLEQARGGSLDALAQLGDVTGIDTAVVEPQVASLDDSVRRVVADAREGRYGIGSDVCHSLTVLNIWHPDLAEWDPVIELLDEDRVDVGSKRATLGLLAHETERIPEAVREPLTRATLRMARQEGKVMHTFLEPPRDASAEAVLLAMALGAFDPSETARHITRLLDGEADDREWAAIIAGRNDSPSNRGLLVSLISDPSPRVRAAAAISMARCGARDPDSLLVAALERCAEDPGRSVAIQLAFGLESLEASEDASARQLAASLRDKLSAHPSARVRDLAARPA